MCSGILSASPHADRALRVPRPSARFALSGGAGGSELGKADRGGSRAVRGGRGRRRRPAGPALRRAARRRHREPGLRRGTDERLRPGRAQPVVARGRLSGRGLGSRLLPVDRPAAAARARRPERARHGARARGAGRARLGAPRGPGAAPGPGVRDPRVLQAVPADVRARGARVRGTVAGAPRLGSSRDGTRPTRGPARPRRSRYRHARDPRVRLRCEHHAQVSRGGPHVAAARLARGRRRPSRRPKQRRPPRPSRRPRPSRARPTTRRTPPTGRSRRRSSRQRSTIRRSSRPTSRRRPSASTTTRRRRSSTSRTRRCADPPRHP